MNSFLKKKFKNFFSYFGYEVIKKKNFLNHIEVDRKLSFHNILQEFKRFDIDINDCFKIFPKLTSQFFQDLFVLTALNFKNNGKFLEAGACDGIFASNTFVLEKFYNWSGILVEPNSHFLSDLKKNRNNHIFYGALNNKNIEVDFVECLSPELSYISSAFPVDSWQSFRKKKELKTIKSFMVYDLLEKFDYEQKLDYLSLDTEGSELEILGSIDYKKTQISIITVEHNFTNKRNEIKTLLENKGYKRVFEKFSYCDDWYISDKIKSFNYVK